MAEAMPSAFMSWQFCGGRGFSHGRQTADSSLCSEWQFLAGRNDNFWSGWQSLGEIGLAGLWVLSRAWKRRATQNRVQNRTAPIVSRGLPELDTERRLRNIYRITLRAALSSIFTFIEWPRRARDSNP